MNWCVGGFYECRPSQWLSSIVVVSFCSPKWILLLDTPALVSVCHVGPFLVWVELGLFISSLLCQDTALAPGTSRCPQLNIRFTCISRIFFTISFLEHIYCRCHKFGCVYIYIHQLQQDVVYVPICAHTHTHTPLWCHELCCQKVYWRLCEKRPSFFSEHY